MASRFPGPEHRFRSLLLLACLSTVLLVAAVSGYGYSKDYEGYLGETIALNGVSYNSDTIYLFMTGPGLPENGVTLTDTSQLAANGDFTTIGVNSDQTWSYKWDTMRLDDQIDPGTYTVYAVNAPVDKSNLDGHSYQTLSVYLKDGMLAKDRVSVGTKYTLNLAADDPVTTVTTVTTPPTSPPTTIVTETTIKTEVPTPSPTPAKKSPLLPFAALLATAIAGSFCILRRGR
ncbi:hypothetical protein [Methanoregula sp.]|uniref:hypothetical protein n=1 Tax=Methanoregula sp. TaxID=2052170 RepID=UPI00236CBDC4|nr:hypothetical protein [Methanoregula sp.]MDD1687817.1 hypothetical protein [Methanoregula sp.]